MEKILSEEKCDLLLLNDNREWERIDRYGKYHQVFIQDVSLEQELEIFFGRKFKTKPIIKILKFEKGDSIPTFSADYSSMTDEYYKRYINTNFIIQVYLNSNFEGGELTKVKTTFTPKTGYGIIQNKTEKCSISKVIQGTAYLLFVFILDLNPTTLL